MAPRASTAGDRPAPPSSPNDSMRSAGRARQTRRLDRRPCRPVADDVRRPRQVPMPSEPLRQHAVAVELVAAAHHGHRDELPRPRLGGPANGATSMKGRKSIRAASGSTTEASPARSRSVRHSTAADRAQRREHLPLIVGPGPDRPPRRIGGLGRDIGNGECGSEPGPDEVRRLVVGMIAEPQIGRPRSAPRRGQPRRFDPGRASIGA